MVEVVRLASKNRQGFKRFNVVDREALIVRPASEQAVTIGEEYERRGMVIVQDTTDRAGAGLEVQNRQFVFAHRIESHDRSLLAIGRHLPTDAPAVREPPQWLTGRGIQDSRGRFAV